MASVLTFVTAIDTLFIAQSVDFEFLSRVTNGCTRADSDVEFWADHSSDEDEEEDDDDEDDDEEDEDEDENGKEDDEDEVEDEEDKVEDEAEEGDEEEEEDEEEEVSAAPHGRHSRCSRKC